MPLFGTNGIRGVLNETLDPELGYKLGMTIGTYYDSDQVAVGYDNRTSSEILKDMVIAGVLNSGKDATDLGMIPTPALQIYSKINSLPGIMITASHNPSDFNGLKVIAMDGTNPGRSDESKIEEIIAKETYMKTTWDFIGRVRHEDAIRPYINSILKNVKPNEIRKHRFRILVDCANSTTYVTTPLILNKLGTHYVSVNANPDGLFPGRSPEPTEENIKDLISFAKTGGFDLSAAHDGDGDRAVFLDEKGNMIDGDKLVALLADYILEKKKGDLVFPVASTFLIDRIAEKHGVKVIRTPVGSPVVSEALIKYKGLLGGEENGKIILPEHLNAGDGGLSLALVLDIMASTGSEISKIASALPDYKLRRLKMPLVQDFEKFKSDLKNFYQRMEHDEIDGLRLVSKDNFILVRKSGTEPLMRVYISSMSDEWIESREKEIIRIIKEN
jgi:phosphomannomutase/phosphoglucomutase